MNPINTFRSIEDNYLRGDSYEGVSQIWNLPSGQFEIPEINFKGSYVSLHLAESYENVLGNIYSLYSVSSLGIENPEDFYVDERIANFGTHAVIIKNIPEFFTRIGSSLKVTGHRYYRGFVKYYDKTKINERIIVFQKPIEFEYQREFRFYLERNGITPFSFKIGSLRRIAEIFPSNYLLHLHIQRNKR